MKICDVMCKIPPFTMSKWVLTINSFHHIFFRLFFNNKDKWINIGKIIYNNDHFGCIRYTTWWSSTRTYWKFNVFWIISFYKLIFEFWSFQHVINIINERIDTHVQLDGLFKMWQSWRHNFTKFKFEFGNWQCLDIG